MTIDVWPLAVVLAAALFGMATGRKVAFDGRVRRRVSVVSSGVLMRALKRRG